MKMNQNLTQSWRVAVVSQARAMDEQHYLDGLFHRAGGIPEVCVQRFDAAADDFRRAVVDPLRAWRPHGAIVLIPDLDRLRRLRRAFPSLPLVSMAGAPPDLVQTAVTGDLTEVLTTARDFFHGCGLSNIAVFCLDSASTTARYSATLRTVIPDGLDWVFPLDLIEARTPAERKRQRRFMTEGLQRLPKPVGILARETTMAPFLLDWCKQLGWRVPQDVQIIGRDEEDRCLACEPRLTSYVVPYKRIGEAALDTMLRLLRREEPPPPPTVRVSGGVIVPRDSTALQKVGRPAVVRAIARIRNDAVQGLTAGDVTRLSKVGHSTFYKEFSAATGDTPGRYLRKIRLEQACRLLRETNDTVTAVGRACGFTSLQSFANFFRRQTGGQTPTQYREAEGSRRPPATGAHT